MMSVADEEKKISYNNLTARIIIHNTFCFSSAFIELEKKIKDGNRKLKEKSDYLFDLEMNVTSIKEFIDDKIYFYNNCLP